MKNNKTEIKLNYRVDKVGGGSHYLLKFKETWYSAYISLFLSPNGNCQAGGIAYLNVLLECIYFAEESLDREKLKYKFAYICRNKIAKKLYIIDVRQDILRTPKFKLFKEQFCVQTTRVKKNNYISTNGSHMCLTMIELDFKKLGKVIKDFEAKYKVIWDIEY